MKIFPFVSIIVFFSVALVQAQVKQFPPGSVLYERYADSAFDMYDVAPDTSQQQWFRDRFYRMDVFEPYFNTRTQWYPRAIVYLNLYGVDPADPIVVQHPDWLMHDAAGNKLWIPFECNTVVCAHYAGDFSNPNFRAWWIANTSAIMTHGYTGMLLDDVDMDLNATNAYYGEALPVNYTTKQPMTQDVWRNEMAGFLEEIRRAFPNVEISHNSVWYSNTACCYPNWATLLNRDLDPSIQRQIAAANVINKEAGIASDVGLQGGTGLWSLNSLFSYFDRLHAAGKTINIAEYNLDRTGQEYGLAGYFMISNGTDRYADRSTTPNNWWNGFNVNLGNPYGARTWNNGLYRRNFTGGIVLLNDPWGPMVTIPLSEPYTRLDGSVVSSVTLGPRQGAILLGAGAPGKWVSDQPWIHQVDGVSLFKHDTTTRGNVMSLNGIKYLKGVGTSANSEMHFNVNGCTRLTATVGVDDEVLPASGSAQFQVWADGRLIFDTGHMASGTPAQPVDLNLAGLTTISLVVIDPGYGTANSSADWANAHMDCP